MAQSKVQNKNPVIFYTGDLGQTGEIAAQSVYQTTYTPPTKSGYTACVMSVTMTASANRNYGTCNVGWTQTTPGGSCSVSVNNNGSAAVNPSLKAKILYIRT